MTFACNCKLVCLRYRHSIFPRNWSDDSNYSTITSARNCYIESDFEQVDKPLHILQYTIYPIFNCFPVSQIHIQVLSLESWRGIAVTALLQRYCCDGIAATVLQLWHKILLKTLMPHRRGDNSVLKRLFQADMRWIYREKKDTLWALLCCQTLLQRHNLVFVRYQQIF